MSDLHTPWRDGEETTRIIEVGKGLSFNVLLPQQLWDIYDWIGEAGWDLDGMARAAWQTTLEYEGPVKELGDYEVFRRYLRHCIYKWQDGIKAVAEGRANDNFEQCLPRMYGRFGRHYTPPAE